MSKQKEGWKLKSFVKVLGFLKLYSMQINFSQI